MNLAPKFFFRGPVFVLIVDSVFFIDPIGDLYYPFYRKLKGEVPIEHFFYGGGNHGESI